MNVSTFSRRPLQWLRRLSEQLARRHELDALPTAERRQLLADLHLSKGELRGLTENPRWHSLLPAMMDKFGVSQAAAERHPLVLRDLQRLCAGCKVQRRCAEALNAGAGVSECRGFCPNSYTLDALASHRAQVIERVV